MFNFDGLKDDEHGKVFIFDKKIRQYRHTSTARKVLTIMQAGLAIRKYYSGFQGSRKNFVFNDTYRNQRLPKANLWTINYCILEMKPAISLPEYFKSVKKLKLVLRKNNNKNQSRPMVNTWIK